MCYRVVPLFSARAEVVLFEVYDEAGHGMILEADELGDLGRDLGNKVVFGNFETTKEDVRRMRYDGRRSAQAFARRNGFL